MRRLGLLLAVCGWVAAQTPFAPCPAAVRTDRVAAAAAPAVAGHARHHRHHHHAGPAAAAAGAVDLTVPAPPRHGGSCTMLTRCEWVAVPTQRVGTELSRDLASALVAGHARVPRMAEPSSPTPPPRQVA